MICSGVKEMINKAKKYAKRLLEADASGHDFYHTLRVLHLAEQIAAEESRFRQLDMELVHPTGFLKYIICKPMIAVRRMLFMFFLKKLRK